MSYQEKKSKLKRNALLVDSASCIGCHACETACKMEHDLPAEARPIKVIELGPVERDGELLMNFQVTTCFHCDRAACVMACPTGAMKKTDDGVVYSDRELCIGCQTCAVACPFGVPQLDPATGKIAKCDGCRERVDQGLWPSCALKCPTGALIFGTSLRTVQDVRVREALRIVKSFSSTECKVE